MGKQRKQEEQQQPEQEDMPEAESSFPGFPLFLFLSLCVFFFFPVFVRHDRLEAPGECEDPVIRL